MIAQADAHDIERFRNVIVRRMGLHFDDARLEFLREVLHRRLHQLRISSDLYLLELESKASPSELGALAHELTVTETYFFRNREQFRALAEIALPQRMETRRSHNVLRLLSAGCASGEEAYSIAIVTRESIADPSWDVLIRAVDLNPAGLAKAQRARYAFWALRETPPDIQRKWFSADGSEFILDGAVRKAVTFEPRNLADEDPEFWQPESYDVIFCRNVLMYFAPSQMHAALARIARSLVPGGFLFLGHAETLRGVSEDFYLRHTHDTFYYERKRSVSRVAAVDETAPRPIPRSTMVAALSEDWVHVIRQASERVSALVAGKAPPSGATTAIAAPWNLTRACQLLGQERIDDALAYLRGLPPESRADPNVLVFEAALLVQSGKLDAAENSCRRLLSIDELNAGAHYILALCREHAGDLDEAAERDRIAAYLDPGFAMPRLHLGLLARRAGERETARRELGQALVLLKREDAFRVQLFGGGFHRDALLGLCRSALRDCGGLL